MIDYSGASEVTKITIRREELIKALQLVASLAERKPSTPILAYVLVRVEGKRIILTASDSEIEISSFIDADSEWWSKNYRFTMPGKKVLDICRTFGEGSMVELTSTRGALWITNQDSRFHLPILPAEDFPLIDTEHQSFKISFDATELKRLLNKTVATIPTQDIRHYLTTL